MLPDVLKNGLENLTSPRTPSITNPASILATTVSAMFSILFSILGVKSAL